MLLCLEIFPSESHHGRRMFHFSCECERCRQELAEGSAKCSYGAAGSSKGGKGSAPKRRGRKARISR